MSKPTIGLVAFWKNYDRKQTLRAAQMADELGYDSFWIPEAWGYDFVPLLTEIALNTKNIRIGTGIMNVWSRSPGLIGMTTATLDELSEGRFVLGIGTSGKRVIEGFHGRTFDQPLTQVRDVIRVVRALLAGQRISDAGAKRTEYRPFKLEMQPVRKTVPIYVAALKEQSLRSIGEMADGWIPTFWPTDRLGEGRKWIEEGAAKAGRSASEIVTAPFTSVLPIAGAAGEAQAKDIVAFYIGGMGEYYKELLVSFGFAAECDRVEELYKDPKTRTQARDAVSDAMVSALMIQGDPAHCVEELARRRAIGLDLPILNLPYGVPDQVVETFIKLLAPRT